NNVAKHRGCQPPTGWVGDVNRPFERSQTYLSIGHEWILLLLIVFRLAFFLQIELGLFLLFLIAFIFFSSVTHGFLLYCPLLYFTCFSFRFCFFFCSLLPLSFFPVAPMTISPFLLVICFQMADPALIDLPFS